MFLVRKMNTLAIILQYGAKSFDIDTLIALYSTSKEIKGVLDNKHYLLNYLDKNLDDFTFGGFIEAANRSFLGKGCLKYYTPDRCATEVARKGHLDILKLAIEKGADNWNWIAEGAAKGGHLDILEFLIEKGAAEGGRLEIIEYVNSTRT